MKIYSHLFYLAVADASKAHASQKRKNPQVDIPYIAHPVTVAFTLMSLKVTEEETLIAAVLHDVLEDTTMSAKEIKEKYGTKVLKLVQWVSEDKTPDISKKEKRKTWKMRKETMLVKLSKAPLAAKLIAYADDINNLNCLYEDLKSLGKEKVLPLFNSSIEEKFNNYHLRMEKIWQSHPFFQKHPNLIEEYNDLLDKIKKLT